MRSFQIIALTLPGADDVSIATAAARAGEVGVLNLEHTRDETAARDAVERMVRYAKGVCGIKLDSSAFALAKGVIGGLPRGVELAILTPWHPEALPQLIGALKDRHLAVLLDVTRPEHAQLGQELGIDGLIAKGHEAGGWVGEETTFILLQRLLSQGNLPVWAHGGIGLHTAAACYAAGAAGLVLDAQLALTRESSLPQEVKTAIAAMDGSETAYLGKSYRLYSRPGMRATAELHKMAAELPAGPLPEAAAAAWRQAVEARVGWGSPTDHTWSLGQDAAFAAPLASRYRTVGGVLRAMREAVAEHIAVAQARQPLDEGAPLARSHGTRYPIVQGPMTRVSDRVEFAQRVAQEGALPFLALALMRAPDVSALLKETQRLLGDHPWGVGILGFVPLDLRQEQMQAIREYRPPFALIAGGRPDQARALEEDGIQTYLHVPSPGLLRLFLKDGARRFVFEGRECGGHVGPRTSFVLWNTMVDVLLEEMSARDLADCHILFAGGIHDALSASMVAAMAAPLAERGVNLGVLLGTSYLFTEEAVTSGAILPGFQDQAQRCQQTVILESGPGHATRCVPTPYVDFFEEQRQRLVSEDKAPDQIREELEKINVGRLRMASKGITRHPRYGQAPDVPKFVSLDEQEQYSQGLYMIGQLAALRDRTCTMAELHHEVAVKGTQRLAALPAPAQIASSLPPAQPSEIAIVGIGAVLPKAADVQTYWENILNKVNAITEVPRERWDSELYYDPNRNARDKVYSKWGGFIDDIAFDPVEFGMPPNSLRSIDPMQLVALKVAQTALDDAGYLERPIADRTRVSVILGASGGTGDLGAGYVLRASLPMIFGHEASSLVEEHDDVLPEWTEDSFAGLLPNVAAGRIANRFDFGGTSYVVDAACASSLTALYLAVTELETLNTDMAIAGGIDTVQSPFGYLCFSKTQALSPTGEARTFDATADGIVIGEGIVMLILKRLADAERDGDRIYAVIQAIGGASDGKAKGLTAPHAEGQIRAIERAYAKAGVSPLTVELFEAHGTGTVVGDLTEALALATVLEKEGAAPHSAAIGSVKTMVGHTKATAGAAGLAKIALALHHKVLPPTLGVTEPNPKARFGESPLYVNSEARPWVHAEDGTPRRAGVSAFGFGGTNFHAVVEEYTADFLPNKQAVMQRWPSELCLWSAASRQELATGIASLEQTLGQGAQPELADLAYTLYRAFDTQHSTTGVSLAIVALSVDDLRQKLGQAREALSKPGPVHIASAQGIYYADEPIARGNKVAFLFPGQGSQYPNMLRDLAICFPEVREAFEQADRAVAGRFDQPLSSYVFPAPAFTPDEEKAQRKELTQTNIAQPALGAASTAMHKLLQSLGVSPDLVAGHSYGEYPALCAAGVFDADTLAVLSEARGRSIVEAAGDDMGTMAAVRADVQAIAPILEPLKEVWIANLNSPVQTIISGTQKGVAEAVKRLEAEHISGRAIAVACGFHSPLVAPAQQRLARVLSETDFAQPAVEVYSNTLAERYPDEPEAIRDLLTEHLVRPIRFVEQIEAMYAAGARVFVEVGPRNIVTALASQTLGDRPHVIVATDAPSKPGLTQLQNALGQLAAHGVQVRLDRLFQGRNVRRLNLSDLEAETRPEPPSPTTWLVNGGRAKPLHEPPAAPRPQPKVKQAATGSAPNPSQGSLTQPSVQDAPTAAPAAPALPPVVPSSPTAAQHPGVPRPIGNETDQVMLQYQQLMSRFLETQQNVMMAYLQAERPAAVAQPHPESLALPPEVQPVQPAPAIHMPGSVEVPPEAGIEPEPGGAPTLDRAQLKEQLLRVVSERTGYPPDMLKLDVDIEAELGIDSIKRVEILGALQQSSALGEDQLEPEAVEQLTGIRTLGGILDWIENALTADAQEPEHAETAPEAADASAPMSRSTLSVSEEPRSTLVVVPAPPLASAKSQFPSDQVLLITDDGRGVARAVQEAICASGGRAKRVRHTDRSDTDGTGLYHADLTDPAAIAGLVESIRKQHGPIGGIVHTLPLGREIPFEDMDLAAWRDRLRRETKSLFLLAQAVASDLKNAATRQSAWLLAATAMGGAFGMDASQEGRAFVGQGSLGGLVKTLAQEWPTVRCKAIDLDPSNSTETLAEQLMQELAANDDLVEVGYRGTVRQTLRPQEAGLDPSRLVQTAIDSEWVILVTGGARGITAEVAKELAERYRPTLLLVGRSPLPDPAEPADIAALTAPQEIKAALIERLRRAGQAVELAQIEAAFRRLQKDREIRRNLEAMQSTGAKVRYYQADVRDEQAMADLLSGIYGEYGRLDGVIHGAGVIEDKLIEDKTYDSFNRVFDTKADSAFLLSRLLRPESLRFLALFSSASGPFGNRGQCDYAAANEVLNKLALHLDRAWPGRVVSINWGPWEKAGMVSPELQRQFAERGVQLIPVSAGRRVFDRELRYGHKGEAEVIVAGGVGGTPVSTSRMAMPLLHRATISTQDGGAITAIRTLNASDDLYLQDHQLDGKPVLPMAMAIELMAEVVQESWPNLQVIGLRDLDVLKGVILENGPKTVHVVARAQMEVPHEHARASVLVQIVDPEGAGRPHYRTTVDLADKLPEPKPFQPPGADGLQPFPLTVAEAYRRWLFHGPLFQSITEIQGISERGMVATCRPSSPRQCLSGDPGGQWLIDPVVFDSGLQMSILWTRAHLDMTTLISRFQRYHRFGPLSGSGIRCHLEVLSKPQNNILSVNISFVSLDGRLLGLAESVEFPYSRDLNRLAEGQMRE